MWRTWWSLAHVVALLTASVPCLAQVVEASSTSRAEAATRFEDGMKAFDSGDFRHAGEAFDAAYRLAPSIDTVWNAARAWHRAGEIPRAATLYSRYLRDAPPNAKDRAAATAYLATLSRKLARIEVHGDDMADLTVDGLPAEDRALYVSRGSHVVGAIVGGQPVRKDVQVEAGDLVSVVLHASAEPSVSLQPAPREAPEASPASSWRGFSPWVFVGGALLTSVAVGFTIASGVDTDNARSAWNTDEASCNVPAGLAKQLRTNILLGTSIGLGTMTAVLGLWLVDWHGGGRSVQVGLGAPGGRVLWSF